MSERASQTRVRFAELPFGLAGASMRVMLAPATTFMQTRSRIGLFLGPVLFVAVGVALSRAGLPAAAAWCGATVVLMACWWITETLPLWATASLPVVLFPWVGAAPFHEVLPQYFDPINFFFLGGMWIAASMQQWGLHRRIALGIVARLGASPRRIVLGFMLATAFITLGISNTATTMMMFPIGMAVLRKFEEQHGRDDPAQRRFGLALMLGIAYAASIGGIGTKIGTGTNLVFVKQAAGLVEIDFFAWLKLGLPIVALVLPLVWVYLVRVAARWPAEAFAGGQEAILQARAALGRRSRGENIALAAFLTAAALWIFRKDIELGPVTIPGWWNLVWWSWEDVLGRPVRELPAPWPGLLGDVGDAVVAMGVALCLMITPARRRPVRFALGMREAGAISWDMLVLLGGGFAMAYGIQRSGLSSVVAELFKGAGDLHPLLATLAVCYLALFLTEVASNVATANILLPLIASSAASFGLHPAPLMFAATLACSFGFMLPAGTPPNAIVYASGYITVPQMARSGLLVDLVGVAIVAVVCYFLTPIALGLR